MTAVSRTAGLCGGIIVGSAILAGGTLAHGIHGPQAAAMAAGGMPAYFYAGAVHMLTGYDHLLFLFGVMFFLTSFREIVTFITAFTIGHSITLIGATLYGLQANYFLIDAVIAISVIYKGIDNLDGFRKWFHVNAPNLLFMVFAFGLIHGFGLATRLQGIGLPHEGLVGNLLAFNAGVEVGQIAALIAMTVILSVARRWRGFASFAIISNTLLVIVGALLFLMQMHSYLHNEYPDDFGFSTTKHIFDHFSNDIPSGDQLDRESPPSRPQQ
jgi:hydrogenase/urease accessory protein HupE